MRYGAVHPRDTEEILSLDIALRRNDRDLFERLPPSDRCADLAQGVLRAFLCHVLHQEYVVTMGCDAKRLNAALLDARGAEYPAEHNVGHVYAAKPALAAHYRTLDPTSIFNPGIGGTSRLCRHGTGCGFQEG